MAQLQNIEPSRIWHYFEEICKIPRISKKEDRILQYLIDFAKQHKLEYRKDTTGNLVILKKAYPGREKTIPVTLQCHMDMVGEKELTSRHDFNKDPITPRIKGNWVIADGTTLGADDGIGIACLLTILEDKDQLHGPLECLFTVEEETGMTGADGLKTGFIKCKILLNLDSEDEGQLFIGCAGGIDTIARLKLKFKSIKPGYSCYMVQLSGLKGGHSGDEIHKKHANAIQLMNRFLWNAAREFQIAISRFEGGNLRNAIPREAEALIMVPVEHAIDFESFFQVFAGIVKKEYKNSEKGLRFVIQESTPTGLVLTQKIQQRLMNAIYACPHGVIGWSEDFEDLVETSTNLASLKFDENKAAVIITSQRSSVESAKKDISDKVRNVFNLARAKITQTKGYPGWTPNLDSDILNITRKSYKNLFKKDPVVKAVHAGLECGIIHEKFPDADMISFGPTIRGAHTPKERINIKSTVKFWRLLTEVLKNIPEV
jgi:dipeptidase D